MVGGHDKEDGGEIGGEHLPAEFPSENSYHPDPLLRTVTFPVG